MDDLGAETKSALFTGKGKYKGADFSFSGPIDHAKLSYFKTTERNDNLQYDAIVFKEKDFVLDISESKLTINGAAVPKGDLLSTLKAGLIKHKKLMQKGDSEAIKHYPADMVFPWSLFFALTRFAQDLRITPEHVEMDYSFNYFPVAKMKLKEKAENDLQIDAEKDALFQLAMSENFFKSLFNFMGSIDTKYSLREIAENNSNYADLLEGLQT